MPRLECRGLRTRHDATLVRKHFLLLAFAILVLAFTENRTLGTVLGFVFIAIFAHAVVASFLRRWGPPSSDAPADAEHNLYTVLLTDGLIASSLLHASMKRGII